METIIRRPLRKKLPPDWVSGLVDGEGSFMVLFNPNPKFKTGWEVRLSFSVSLTKKSRKILLELKRFFGCGSIRFCRRDNTYKYEVRSLSDLTEKVIPHFERYHLFIKEKEFLSLRKVSYLMRARKHRQKEGLEEIKKIAEAINRGRRKRNFP